MSERGWNRRSGGNTKFTLSRFGKADQLTGCTIFCPFQFFQDPWDDTLWTVYTRISLVLIYFINKVINFSLWPQNKKWRKFVLICSTVRTILFFISKFSWKSSIAHMIQNFVKRLNNMTSKNRFFKGFEKFSKFKYRQNFVFRVQVYNRQNFFKKKVLLNQLRIVWFVEIPNFAKSTFCIIFGL